MNKVKHMFSIRWLLVPLSILWCLAYGAQEFIIEDIRVEGLRRVTPGTVFNYLPVQVGDRFDETRSPDMIRTLFKTGFFEDVQLKRNGNILVFTFVERPAIGSITVTGNKDIKTEELLENLSGIGFSEGRVFAQAQLDQVEQELQRQYYSRGKYGATVKTSTTPLDDDRLAVSIDITEGKPATIKQINIIGNTIFAEKKLLEQFELTTPTLFSFFSKRDQYSRQKLSGDLESLRSFYLDYGYLNFNIDSTQVSITPDKKDIYITINITEGEKHTVSDIKFAGDFILVEENVKDLVLVERGQIFSRQKVTESTELLIDTLGNQGYAFANVNTIPDINKENKEVSITFFIDSGKRAYVRRISFEGNQSTRDEVLRREMRQQESAWVSTSQIERGKLRLQRLGFFSDVNVETPAVEGSVDQVDVEYSVVEQPSGSFNIGLGYSQSQGFILQTSVAQNNFLGSGKRLSFAFNNSDVNRNFQLGYNNPYFTVDGISRGFNLFHREIDALNANITAFDIKESGGNITFGYPVSEHNTLFSSLEYVLTDIQETANSSRQVMNFVNQHGTEFDLLKITTSFRYDTRNRAILPDSGLLSQVVTEVSVPFLGDSLEYYKVNLSSQWFQALYWDLILSARADIGVGGGYGDTGNLPFFENFYAGGANSVRGYEANTLGPKDSSNLPIGGELKFIGSVELILPIPFLKGLDSVRVTSFFDTGNVYSRLSNFDAGELRNSVGLGIIWVSPFGQVSASFAQPISEKSDDRIQRFQFNFGTSF